MWLPEHLKDSPFKLKVLNYSRNCSLHATLIPNLVKPLTYILLDTTDTVFYFTESARVSMGTRFNVINCMHRFLILYYRPLYFKYTLCELRLQASIA